MLIRGLPADSALQRHGSWSRQDELAALILERSEQWFALLASAWGVKPLPDLIGINHPDRPEDKPSRKTTNDPREIAAWMAGVTGGR